jgi:hypothetical protein
MSESPETAAWRVTRVTEGELARWIPLRTRTDLHEFHDQRVVVSLLGFSEPQDFWAKADGFDEEYGAPRYKLLPLDRA